MKSKRVDESYVKVYAVDQVYEQILTNEEHYALQKEQIEQSLYNLNPFYRARLLLELFGIEEE